ncbi:MAG: ABC transporter ATP-binding protein [Comamonadaceae bacterium SCN 68-20]|nr:MAG: ABC transporter ATP-binding protein [Comamonadaceae bacterium SCN 68-20]
MLQLTNIQIVYDNTIEAVREASFTLGERRIVALLGANGAGKSTTLKAISGVLYPEDGEVKAGDISFEGRPLRGLSPDRIVRAGIVMVPEGRRLFDQLTVEENLLMGGYTRSRADSNRGLQRVYELFPRIASKRNTVSGYLSGGEQQMVAIGRALMSQPKLLMLDEPTLGLAPQICEEIVGIVTRLCRQEGVSILLVEQNAQMALSIADDGFIMENGRIVLDGPAEKLLRNEDVREFYLGFGEGGSRKNMRDVKHYKRRKRWLS